MMALKFKQVLTKFTDINECVANTDNCATTADCTNTDGSFTCACWDGYSGDGVTCTGIMLCEVHFFFLITNIAFKKYTLVLH